MKADAFRFAGQASKGNTKHMDAEGAKKYDAWLHWLVLNPCNLRCAYCTPKASELTPQEAEPLGQRMRRKAATVRRLGIAGTGRTLLNRLLPAKTAADKVTRIDADAFVEQLDKTGLTFRVGFTGGEPFLVPNIVEACEKITRKHYVSFNTNLTLARIAEFVQRIDPQRVIEIHASCHIKELDIRGLIDRYCENYRLCKEAGFAIKAVARAYPPLLGELGRYREIFASKGVELEIGMYCGDYEGKHYPEAYTEAELAEWNLEEAPDIKFMSRCKGQLCNAGYNVAIIDPEGVVYSCFLAGTPLGDISKGFKFRKTMLRCPVDYCSCPLNCYDVPLFERALEETKQK